jgi:hypothetical protein
MHRPYKDFTKKHLKISSVFRWPTCANADFTFKSAILYIDPSGIKLEIERHFKSILAYI